jgi:hypothetical protein
MPRGTLVSNPVWPVTWLACGHCNQGFWKWFGLGVVFSPLTLAYVIYAVLCKRWVSRR